MSTELQTIINFCLEHAEQIPVGQRVLLYRGLAEFCCDEIKSAQFNSMADDLESAHLRLRELKLNYAGSPAGIDQESE